MNELRIVKRKDGDDWTLVRFSELKINDVFIMFESVDNQIGGEWIAKSCPMFSESGVWGIEALAIE